MADTPDILTRIASAFQTREGTTYYDEHQYIVAHRAAEEIRRLRARVAELEPPLPDGWQTHKDWVYNHNGYVVANFSNGEINQMASFIPTELRAIATWAEKKENA